GGDELPAFGSGLAAPPAAALISQGMPIACEMASFKCTEYCPREKASASPCVGNSRVRTPSLKSWIRAFCDTSAHDPRRMDAKRSSTSGHDRRKVSASAGADPEPAGDGAVRSGCEAEPGSARGRRSPG